MSTAVAGRLARFELQRVLGRGAQAQVWLAHDPRLDREVAVKVMNPGADAISVSQWLHEARACSRLTHPNVVPVFEADEHEGQPYLVFEFVDGPTLAQARKGGKPMPAREAVAVVMGILDALAAAHELGIVHRDLKPSNILMGRDGRPRVMDFGIAARVAQRGHHHDGLVVGTPGYISPEAARGEAPLPAMDVFAAGAMLGELLAGEPLLRESDPYRAVERVQREDLALPPHVKADATLRGIVKRALSRDLGTRYDSARAMHTALEAWLNPSDAAAPEAGSSHATLEFLLRRMRHRTDFPALSASIVRIQKVAVSETESIASLSEEILKDVALTNKLLRMVNSVHFTSVAGGGISTVSRAVALVGFAGIRNMALSVVLLEHMEDKQHAALLKQEFLRSLMAGTLADSLTPVAREAEEAYLGAMFQNLGRLLVECYLPEEATQIRQAIEVHAHMPSEGALQAMARETAAKRVLGLGLDELGAGVAKAWGLPDTLQRAMRAPMGELPDKPERGGERLRWVGRSANAMADAMLSADGDAQARALRAAAELYAPVIGVSARHVVEASYSTRDRMKTLADAMGVRVAHDAPARRLLEDTQVMEEAKTVAHPAPSAAGVAPAGAQGTTERSVLSHAVADLQQRHQAGTLRAAESLPLALDAMHRGVAFRCIVLCLRDPRTGRLQGRVGLGPEAQDMATLFKVQPDAHAAGDLFAFLCAKGADLLVSDSRTVINRLPGWYRENINAPTFLLLPLMVRGKPIGLIYADKARAGEIHLPDHDLALLRTLRDHMATSIEHAH